VPVPLRRLTNSLSAGVVLPRVGLQVRIIRTASRTETGGHWAPGEAWQDPGFDIQPRTRDEAEPSTSSKGDYTFYTDTDLVAGVGPGTFVFIPPGAIHGFRTGPAACCGWTGDAE
jgi:hypothetical protein